MPEPKHLLLVEDDIPLRNALLELLAGDLGFDVDTAGSTNEALRLLDRGAYDLVFSDNQFPRFADSHEVASNQGLELLQWMRFEKKYEDTPFILHTIDDLLSIRIKVADLKGIFCAKGAQNHFEQIIRDALLVHA